MPSRSIMERLRDGESLLLDGGTGSELQRRGVDVLKGATDRLQAWSATANLEYPDVVQQVHQDYLRVGADVITSNNFWTAPSRLESIGLQNEWREYARAAAEIALRAREAGSPDACVAGGIAAPSLQGRSGQNLPDVEIMADGAFKQEYRDHATLLADVGVDLILAEYVGFIDDCVAAVDASAEAGLPVFLGVRRIGQDGNMQYGDSLADLAVALDGHPVDAVLLMCSNPVAISAGLPILRDSFDGPIGAYPNLGYNPTGPLGTDVPNLANQLPRRGQDIFQATGFTPSRIAEFATEWKEMGAQIIGGCCASGPEHIMAMSPVVRGDSY